jgi:ubiquinone/menaquinone biosynthesis C-methylase UbiE
LPHHHPSIDAQHDAIRREYQLQADVWGQRSFDPHLDWVVDQVEWNSSWRVLDVAAGTGLFGQAIANRVASVVAVDLSPEMLAWGRAQASDKGIGNIEFEIGAAEDLPFAAGSFDAVITRYAIHHFAEPAVALREMARVARADARLVVIDMVADEDPEIAARHNELERIADGTHTEILSPSRLIAEVVRAGFSLDRYLSRDVEMVFDRWQKQLSTDAEERRTIRAALEDEIGGADQTGLRPFLNLEVLTFLHTWGIVVAHRRPDAPASGGTS